VSDATRARYEDADVVDFYARHAALQAAEAVLFERYATPGLDVLDLGVGGGRTTPRLSHGARSYVGVDYSEPMVARCRAAFPGLRFCCADATRLDAFADSSFDLVVFSFNGLDGVPTLSGRHACLRECARVLRPGGVLVLSVHNARYLFFPPVFAGAPGLARRAWRVAYALLRSAQLLASRLPSRAFWRGAGYARDPATHGGLTTWIATREIQGDELRAFGFAVEQVLAAPSPEVVWPWAVAWYYYAARKPGDAGPA
jgi:SAM-dependent methyltransferase